MVAQVAASSRPSQGASRSRHNSRTAQRLNRVTSRRRDRISSSPYPSASSIRFNSPLTSKGPDFGSRTDFYTFLPEGLAEALPEFELLREVGKGSMGIVYEARRKEDDLRVAIKVVPPSLSLTERAIARFLREGEIMSRVEHETIVRVYDLGHHDRIYYFVMEFIDGINLEERMKVGPLAVRQTAEIGKQAAEALHFAHERGVVHRDIKPGNLILRENGTIAITDFGLARETGTGSMTESGAIVGTPMFMAPEQILGDKSVLGSRADVYGLGTTLYTLVTGQPPFVGPTAQSVLRQVLDENPIRPSKQRADLPRSLENIILMAMAKDPAERYGTAQDLAEDLGRFLNGDRVHARLPGPLKRLYRGAKNRPLLTSLYALISMLIIGATSLYHDRQLRELEHQLSVAETTLLEASSLRDDHLRPYSSEDRKAKLRIAIGQATSVLEQDSSIAQAWFLRAKANHELQRYAESLADLARAEQLLKSPSLELIYYRIDALTHFHDATSEQQLLEQLRRLIDRNATTQNRCLCAEHMLRMAAKRPRAERIDLLDEVAEVLEPAAQPDARVLMAKMRLAALRGHLRLAFEILRDAFQIHPNLPLVQNEAMKLLSELEHELSFQDESELLLLLAEYGPKDTAMGRTEGMARDEARSFLRDLSHLIERMKRDKQRSTEGR